MTNKGISFSEGNAPLVDALIQAVKAERDEFHERCNNSYSTEALMLCNERVALCKQALLARLVAHEATTDEMCACDIGLCEHRGGAVCRMNLPSGGKTP